MALHPDKQRKAQEEIDRVIGSDRLPTFKDRESLPYVEAIYREMFRWLPPLPLTVPHVAQEDDVYKGYFIPKGKTIVRRGLLLYILLIMIHTGTVMHPNIWYVEGVHPLRSVSL